MKVGVFVNTPAQVHFFRPFVRLLQERGHEPLVLARYHPEARRLLEETGLAHVVYAVPAPGKWGKLAQLPRDVASARRLLAKHGVDVAVGFGVYDVFASSSLRLPSVVFTDTEARYHGLGLHLQYGAFARLATTIVTPDWFGERMGRHQVRIRTFKEVAYLHPSRFKPDPSPKGLGGLDPKEPYAFLRLSAHGALHDAGHRGLQGEALVSLLARLERRMRVWASFEGGPPKGLERFACPADKGRIHDILYHAALVIGDSGSIPAEAAFLGAPSLRFTSIPAERDMGGWRELVKVGLMETFRDVDALAARSDDFPLSPASRAERRASAAAYMRSLVDPLEALVGEVEAAALQGRRR